MIKSCRGFTLIELLVVAAVIGIILGVGMAQFARFNRSQLVAQVANEIRSDLRLVQSKALAGELPDACGSKSLDGYEVEFCGAIVVPPCTRNSYILRAVCKDVKPEIKTVRLPDKVTLTPPTVNPVLFNILGLGSNIPEPDGAGEAVVIIRGFGTSQEVVISHTGDIK